MISADAISDLVLLLACVVAAWHCGRRRPGLVAALTSIALAAAVGVARFSAVDAATGPHAFFSLIATVAAVPLLAAVLYWPNGLLATHPRAAALWLIFTGAFGVVLIAATNWHWYAELVPAVSLLLLLAAIWRQPSRLRWAGVALLMAGFLVHATQGSVAGFSAVQGLHYAMAAGLPLLVWRVPAERH